MGVVHKDMESALLHAQAREAGRGCDNDSATVAIAVADFVQENQMQ